MHRSHEGLPRIGPKVGAATGLSIVVVLTATLPVAYSSQELFGVENQTYWYEYDAVKRMSEHGVTSYTSDQRLGETGWRLFNLNHQQWFELKSGSKQ